MTEYKATTPTTLVIFGASGNLATVKLFPALYELLKYDHLPDDFQVVAVLRSTSTTLEHIMQRVEEHVLKSDRNLDSGVFEQLKNRIRPIVMDSTSQEDHYRLRDMLDGIDEQTGVQHQRVFYLAIPPSIFTSVINCLAGAGQNDESSGLARRIFVEKPFGSDYASAKTLIDNISQHFTEQQIYRIDHYLAKENAQNILTFRFMNPLIKDVWKRENIASVHVRAFESIGIEGRGEFYDGLGAVRDLIQSHLLQLLALVTLRQPSSLDSSSVHAAKLELLKAIQPAQPQQAARGQYESYQQEANRLDSSTETYARVQLAIDNDDWRDIPIILETGKALDRKETSIDIVFQDCEGGVCAENLLTIRLQPDEGITLRLAAKLPGFSAKTQPVDMKFDYRATFAQDSPEAYERVLYDAMVGDQTLFTTGEEVLECWRILQPILDAWNNSRDDMVVYPKGQHARDIVNK